MACKTVHSIAVAFWRPTPLNKLLNAHWTKRRALKKADEQVIGLAARLQGTPKATRKRRVSLYVTVSKGMRRCDEDAYWKSVFDALKNLGYLVNDSPVWCQKGNVVQVRGQAERTVILLEDL